MAKIKIEGCSEQEVILLARQMGITLNSRIYKSRKGLFTGYSSAIVDGSTRISVTEEQVLFIAKVIQDRLELEHAKSVYEESQIIDVDFVVSKKE